MVTPSQASANMPSAAPTRPLVMIMSADMTDPTTDGSFSKKLNFELKCRLSLKTVPPNREDFVL